MSPTAASERPRATTSPWMRPLPAGTRPTPTCRQSPGVARISGPQRVEVPLPANTLHRESLLLGRWAHRGPSEGVLDRRTRAGEVVPLADRFEKVLLQIQLDAHTTGEGGPALTVERLASRTASVLALASLSRASRSTERTHSDTLGDGAQPRS